MNCELQQLYVIEFVSSAFLKFAPARNPWQAAEKLICAADGEAGR
jgi:hypothetical protein